MLLRDLIDDAGALRTCWPSEPQVYRRDPAALRALLTMAEVDALIDSECIPSRNVVLLRDGAVVDPREYTDGDMPRPGSIRAHLNQGQSISLRLLHTMRPGLARLKGDAQRETGCRTHINAYLTPGNCQGLRYHYDPYVTLIVQLHGRKTWHLHPPLVERPTEEFDNFIPRRWTAEERDYLAHTPPSDVVLEPGHVFWLPRGWVHSPETTGEEPSLHLTLALKQRTRAWLVEHLAEAVVRHVRADFEGRDLVTPSDLFEGTEGLEWARRYAIGALLGIDAEASARAAREKARNT
ncbi:JmjC domain-containing protein [Streptomyces misionensis]|uniref:JmjC domain-containing protein n=1 Tax=Streptomyces misionensis TaxID=67331 RepID=UPI0036CDA902